MPNSDPSQINATTSSTKEDSKVVVDDWFIPNQSRICTSPTTTTTSTLATITHRTAPSTPISSAFHSIFSNLFGGSSSSTPHASSYSSQNISRTSSVGNLTNNTISRTSSLENLVCASHPDYNANISDDSFALSHSLDDQVVLDNPVALLGRLDSTKQVCTVGIANQIRSYLPALGKLTDSWHLIYSMDQHGISLSTLYSRMLMPNKSIQSRGFILIIQDGAGQIFGAYLSDILRVSQPAFYGTGETFVFKSDEHTQQITPYLWTGMNDYFIYGDLTYFAIGASDGNFAIWLDNNLEYGKSDPVSTFDNPVLSSNRNFECYELEIWGLAV